MSDDYENITIAEFKDTLRKWRENNERRSRDICRMYLVSKNVNDEKLGNERPIILEQVFYAALDCHNYGIATFIVIQLSELFPGSLRVMRHKAALMEAKERYDEAIEVLDNIITVDETNAPARKRRIAIMKAQGHITEAIKELVDYLKKFMSDVEAWQELCGLYQQAGEYARAAFCAEELLLHQPHHHLAHQRLADIRYTMGGIENLELAKTYYCQALKLNPDNMRALLGLFLVTNNLVSQYKSSGNTSRRREAHKLGTWAAARAAPGAKGLAHAFSALAITD